MKLRKNLGAAGFLGAGSARTLQLGDDDRTVLLNTLTGSVVTLPAALGRGLRFRFVVSLLATSNSHIVKVGNAVDVFRGIISGHRVDLGNDVLAFAAGVNDDTITLNRTTTGSVALGEWLYVEDIAAGIWHVRGALAATGAAFATPFSATV